MATFLNAGGQPIVERMIAAIQQNKDYLGEIDGLIGDGDHGMNMNKGFTMAGKALAGEQHSFTQCLDVLGSTLFNDIGGSMGPIYGTIFIEMADAAQDAETIDIAVFDDMLQAAQSGLFEVVEARVGDKTLMDAFMPACQVIHDAAKENEDFAQALSAMAEAAEKGKESTKDLVAKFGRSSRLGERSRGVLDAGATSCCLLLQAMAAGMREQLAQ